ncbi:MAG: tetratricopeptide repeat protein [Spirochaetota bacterium]|nr:MAG: tetratricopeptide repeat protein [Spirochaetota bacterium]
MEEAEKVEQLLTEGEKHLKEQSFEKALINFLTAYEMDKKNSDTLYLLGITYTRIGKYESALFNFEQMLNLDISYINKIHTQMVMGYIYTILDDLDRALELFREIVDAGFESAQVFAAIGYIMDRRGNFKEACMNLYRAIDIDPKNANARNSLGYIYAEAGINLEEALAECKKAVAIDKENPAYLDSLGWVYYKLGKLSQAKSYLKKASKMAHENEEIQTHLRIVSQNSK